MVTVKLDYLYNTKKIDEIGIGDIIFTEVNENNLPICEFIVLDHKEENTKLKTVFCLEDREIIELNLTDHNVVYYLGNIYQKLSIKELMKNVQKRYVWLGIEYDLVKVLVNLLDGTVEKYNNETEEWEYLDDEVEDNGYMMTLTFDVIRFRINLTNLKVQIMNEHTVKFRNYNNYLLGLEGQYVFNEDNELELIDPKKDTNDKGGN